MTKRANKTSAGLCEAIGVTEISRSNGKDFTDTGLRNAEERLFKARIVAVIDAAIRSQKLTQIEAARRMGIAQPDVSRLVRGRFSGFSIDRLTSFLLALGCDIRFEIAQPPTNDDYERGHLELVM